MKKILRPLPAGRGIPLPAPYPSQCPGASTNAPSALDLSTLPPLKLKSGYAPLVKYNVL